MPRLLAAGLAASQMCLQDVVLVQLLLFCIKIAACLSQSPEGEDTDKALVPFLISQKPET